MPWRSSPWTVVDLFSGAGGASAGFAAHPWFTVVAAADAQVGKPSSGSGSLGCNETYAANIGVAPVEVDLGSIEPEELRTLLRLDTAPSVLIACPPCTGFTRTNSANHLRDDPRNGLVSRVAAFARVIAPEIVVLENARELLMGRFRGHFEFLERDLTALGYEVAAETHYLTRFGLPQIRERAVVVAARRPLRARTLSELWAGFTVDEKATHVRRVLWGLPRVGAGQSDPHDPVHVAPAFRSADGLARIRAVPPDGGSWRDLLGSRGTARLMTPGMRSLAGRGDFGSFPDAYGRMAWDRPAPTIKRESGHVGNGRYAHPEQDRLCTVREMALLQGFPETYRFGGSLTNRYRHVGDAVPPLVSRQLASVAEWILTGQRPTLETAILAGTHLTTSDILRS